MMFSVAVAGASGYAGGEILRLLGQHPHMKVTTVTGSSTAGDRLIDHQPHLTALADLRIRETTVDVLAGYDVVFLALPHGHSGKIGEELAQKSPKTLVVDCAADHRLTSATEWERYYASTFSPAWTYGMPELIHAGEHTATAQRAALAQTQRIAVPGCNVTAVTLAIQPAVHAGIVDATALNATLAVGYSGAGKKAATRLLASEALGNLVPYGVGGTHRHIPEIIQNLHVAGGQDVRVAFTPVLVPVSRGILATVTAPLRPNVTPDQCRAALEIYREETAIDVLGNGEIPTTKPVIGTGRAQVNVFVDDRAGVLVALAAIDNLGKGTGTAAIQSANLALGLDEWTGIPMIGVTP
ncbi:N-acetyl-gamma-glutamyl-phosphate reductase [Schaalia sp. ZJ1691]|uniref:N-acetyl-gamma-glutamyl-phosphate reductase n=1 Tax=Schaalia sp. ZJ1691 TaxID=2709404 RepID=UPI0013EA81AC|nr:N-acetyl-gamma-glutamyl-phosphate reductase [Schaalia sp. ZJ1691]